MLSKVFGSCLLFSVSNLAFSIEKTHRLEVDFKLDLPDDKKEDLLSYLHKKTQGPEKFVLNGETLGVEYAEEDFTDAYYDDTNQNLLKQDAGLRHRRRINLTDAASRKNGRELVQLKVSTKEKDDTLRQEFKFKPEKKIETEGLLGSLNEKNQDQLRETLARLQVDSKTLTNHLTNLQRRHRFMITRPNKDPFMTITLDDSAITSSKGSAHFLELEIEINEKPFTDATEKERENFFAFASKIKEDLMKDNSYLTVDQTPKYNKAAQLLEAQASSNTKTITYSILAAGALIIPLVILL